MDEDLNRRNSSKRLLKGIALVLALLVAGVTAYSMAVSPRKVTSATRDEVKMADLGAWWMQGDQHVVKRYKVDREKRNLDLFASWLDTETIIPKNSEVLAEMSCRKAKLMALDQSWKIRVFAKYRGEVSLQAECGTSV